MRFNETSLKGAYVIELEKREDSRGYFARTFCEKEFRQLGLETAYVQGNCSYNKYKGTLRGLHFQRAPHEEVKVVRCTSGAVFDVALDLRRDSPTFGKWFAIELTPQNGLALYVPRGFAHGYVTLKDDSEIFYQVSAFYEPKSEGGVRWNDPRFGVKWPFVDEKLISDKDRALPDYA